MLDDTQQASTAGNSGSVVSRLLHQPDIQLTPRQVDDRHAVVLQVQWLEEAWLNARRILSDQDPFLQALSLQRQMTGPATFAAGHHEPMSLA